MQYLLLCASSYRRLYQASLLVEGFLFGLSMISLSYWPLQMISSISFDSQYWELIFQDYLLNHLYKDWGWNLSCLSWRHVMNNVYFLLDIRNLSWLSQPFNDRENASKLHYNTPVFLVGTPWTRAYHLFKCYLTCSSSLTQSFPLISRTWGCWKLVIPVKTRAETQSQWSHIAFQCSLCSQGAWTASSCKSKLFILKNDRSISVSQEGFLGGWPAVLVIILGRFSAVGGTICMLTLVRQVSFTHHLFLSPLLSA